jgi:hypothetical protein
MVVLTRREKSDVADADVTVDCIRSLLLESWWVRGREKANVVWARMRYS